MHRDGAATAPADDGVDRRRQRAHMVPMSVRDGDLLDLAEIEAQVAAVADEDGAFGAGVEQRDMFAAAEARAQAQPVAEVGRQQRLAGDFLGARQHYVGELRHGERCLADIGVADIVGDDLDRKQVENGQGGMFVHGYVDFRNRTNNLLTSSAFSCCTQWPAPSIRWISFMFVQAVFCILSMAPGVW